MERAREERAAARREARRLREAEAQQARESYVIWVIGGYYPENMLAAPNLLLGQFDHDDFWALAEFLGQVKPPVATREDIEKAGLDVIKPQQLADYLKGDKIATNTADGVRTTSIGVVCTDSRLPCVFSVSFAYLTTRMTRKFV